MPRIDPLLLIKCLSVLLTPEGGILSSDEVPRLVNLMTKFSKKLVSKCVYVLILTNTEIQLLDLFMAEGGWTLIQTWLEDAMRTSNDDLVKEIIKLLLISPVDVERLKMNTIPRLVKTLTKREDVCGVKELSSELVQKWLSIVKNTQDPTIQQIHVVKPIETPVVEGGAEILVEQAMNTGEITNASPGTDIAETLQDINSETYKLTVRDGKQVIKRISSTEDVLSNVDDSDSEKITVTLIGFKEDKKDSEEPEKKKHKSDKSKSKSSSSSSKSSSSKSSSSKDRDRNRHKSSSSKSSSSSKDKSSSSSKDKDRDRRDRDKHRSNGSVKHSSNSSSKSSSSSSTSSSKDKKDNKESKEKQAEKDKDTLAKLKPQTLEKIGRIPKKNDEKPNESREVKKKGTMSIEVRKSNEERPKTVKVFNSKMRSTGLEEEVKPPPPRTALKKPSTTLPTIPQKRPSPPRETVVPEKKPKIEIPERPGAIKLIPPKPKPMLQESDIFMDALTASANTKKEPKKRKRRASASKDSAGSPPSSPTKEQQSPSSTSSPLAIKNIAPPNFYQDTLQTDEENKEAGEGVDEKSESIENKEDTPVTAETEKEESPESPIAPKTDGLKGVLVHVKKKGPKRSIRWKPDSDLVEIRHFELDETERINVTKTFMDMAKMEMTSEREALQLSRKLPSEDMMEAQMSWRFPFNIEQPEPTVQPGCKSLEKDIQFAREKSVLQALYFNKRVIPDSPAEPLLENHQMNDPINIPLEDPDSQELDLRVTPWPEPKVTPPIENEVGAPPMFRNMPPNQFSSFPHINPPGFQGIPPQFNPQQGPNGPILDGPPFINPQNNFVPPSIIGNMIGPPNNMMGPPREMMGPMDPNVFGPGGHGPGPDNFNPMINDDGFNNMNNNMPFNPPNMGMFPPNNFNMRGGHRGNFRRGGNSGGWVRMNNGHGGGKWNNRPPPGPPRGNRLCKNFKIHGYCRNIDNCPFVHPN